MTQPGLDELSDDLVLVVDVEDVLSAIERNSRDANTRRDHRLRFNRPLEGQVEGSIHVNKEGHFWPNPDNSPLTLRPMEFIHDGARDRAIYPADSTVQYTAMETDGVDDISDVDQQTLEDCWETHLEIWESEVRNNLNDTVTINRGGQKAESREIPVEYDE